MARIAFTASNLSELHQLIDERVAEIAENFGDERFPDSLPREIHAKIIFQPEKNEPTNIRTYVSAETKLPPRKAKPVLAALRQGKLVIERAEEDQPLFFNETAVAKAQELKDMGAKVHIVGVGGEE